jgi:hypothetical protein
MIIVAIVITCVALFVGLAAVIKGVSATSSHHNLPPEPGLFAGDVGDVITASNTSLAAGLYASDGGDVTTTPNTSLAADVTAANTSHTRAQETTITSSSINAGETMLLRPSNSCIV